jgi:hypothetical protein
VADGRHSQVDGFISQGVLVGVLGVKLDFPLADPLIGFVIGTTILVVAWNSGRELWYRLMDATVVFCAFCVLWVKFSFLPDKSGNPYFERNKP